MYKLFLTLINDKFNKETSDYVNEIKYNYEVRIKWMLSNTIQVFLK